MKNIPEEFQKDYIRTMRKMIGHAPLDSMWSADRKSEWRITLTAPEG